MFQKPATGEKAMRPARAELAPVSPEFDRPGPKTDACRARGNDSGAADYEGKFGLFAETPSQALKELASLADELPRGTDNGSPAPLPGNFAATIRSPMPKNKKQRLGREWIGGRLRFPLYIQNPPVRPDAIIWMDNESEALFMFEAVSPEAPDSVLLEGLRKALNDPGVGAAHRPRRLRVAEARWAEMLRAGLGDEFEIRVDPTPELLEVIRLFVDDCNPGLARSYLGHRTPTAPIGKFFHAAAGLYGIAPWKIVSREDHLLVLDAPQFGFIGASISIIGALGEQYGILVYESVASYQAMARQAEQFGRTVPRRSELRTPALSITFNRPADIPKEMVREVEEYGWELAEPDAYPIVMAFDPDNVPRPMSERDYELAAACCIALNRLLARMVRDPRLDPASARETVAVETLAGRPSVTVSLPLLDLFGPQGSQGSSRPS
jgi:hypothetical protein